MALSEIVLCNGALSRIGSGQQLTSSDGTLANCVETTQAAYKACSLWFETTRDRLLEMHPWPFARKYATLTLNDSGSGEAWEYEWDNAYTYPSDCLKIRRFVNDFGAVWGYAGSAYYYGGPVPLVGWIGSPQWRYVVRHHAGAKVILTDVATGDADLEYTFQNTDVTEWTQSFADTFMWALAAEIAGPLSASPEKMGMAKAMAMESFQSAAANASNEELPRDDGPGMFLTARGSD